MLDEAGNLDNLRNAASGGTAFRGPMFMDSDVYKWLEAAGWELGRSPDPKLSGLVDGVLAIVAAAQTDDGYLNSYFQVAEPGKRWTDIPQGHELYCIGHLVQAAVALSRATGDERLMRIAERAVQNAELVFGDDRRIDVPGHPEIESALIEVYRHTRDAADLKLAAFFLDHRGFGLLGGGRFRDPAYYQDRVPVREATVIEGHAVRATYLMTGVVDAFLETGEEALLAAAERQWRDMVDHKQYLTGAIGSRHFSESFGEPYELPSATAYAETCAAIGSFFWNWRLLLATGEGKYGDEMEWTLYNAILSGISLDGTHFFYENPLSSRGDRVRNEWYTVACCPPNIMRLMASLGHYFATGDAHGVQVHQYGQSTLIHGPIELAVRTMYPWDETVRFEVRATPETVWELALRIPTWCEYAAITVNGATVEFEVKDGYATVEWLWSAGDIVELRLPMPVQLVSAHPFVESARASAAIVRGPLVYCIEACDQPGDGSSTTTLDADAPLRPVWRDDLLGAVMTIVGSGYSRPLAGWDGLYRRRADVSDARDRIEVTAVPYFLWANRESGPMAVWIPVER